MGRYELIRAAIDSLNGGQFQALAQRYLTARYGYRHPYYLGIKAGSHETARGVPDAFWPVGDNRFVFVECGHYVADKSAAKKKIRSDINSCLEYESNCEGSIVVEKIVICFGYGRFEAKDISEFEQIDERVILIGPDQIAEDLYRSFPSLAREYLGLDIDSNQMLEPDAFLEQNENDYFAPSLLSSLIGREKELEDLIKNIEFNRSIVVTGKSGCGKTRLAYEACNAYSKSTGATFFVIRSRHRSVYEDLRTYLSFRRSYIILVDDANDMKDIADLVDYAIDHDDVKIVLTVRNYAAEAVCEAVGRLRDYKRFELPQLGHEDLTRIAGELLNNRNSSEISRIVEMSRGNLRLMYLAAQSANDQGITSIQNMKHLLDLCYGKKLDLLSENERKAAGVSSILGPHQTNGNKQLESLEQLAGINHDNYKASCLSLCEKELLDSMHGIAAVSFEEQNIRDYLIYDAICVSRWITLSDIDSLVESNYHLRRVLNILLEVFGDSETLAEVRRQLYEIWDNADSVRKWDLAKEFGATLGFRALSLAIERITSLPKVCLSWDEDCFSKQSQNLMYEREELGVLDSFFGTKLHDLAVDELLSIVEKGLASANDIRRCFRELAGAMKRLRDGCDDSSVEGFENRFREWFQKDPDRIYCFLSFAQGVMDDQKFHIPWSLDANGASARNTIVSGDSVLKMRRFCIDVIRDCRDMPKVHQPSRDLLLGYRPGWIEPSIWSISVETMNLISVDFVPFFPLESVCDYEMLLRFEQSAHQYGCSAESIGDRLCKNRSSEILVLMLRHNFDLDGRNKTFKALGAKLSVGEYRDLFSFLHWLNIGPNDSWWVTYSVRTMLSALHEQDPARFEQVCLSYLESSVCPDVGGYAIADYAVSKFGALAARDWCLTHAADANAHAIWLHLCNVAAISMGAADEVAECILEEFERVGRPLFFDDICKCELKSNGFLPRYFEKLFEYDEREGRFPEQSLPSWSNDSESLLRDLADRPENITILKKACIKSLKRTPDHCEDGLIMFLATIDPSFAVQLADVAPTIGAHEAMGIVGKVIRGNSAYANPFGNVAYAIYEADDRSVYNSRQKSLLSFINGAIDDMNRKSIAKWIAEKALINDDFGAFIRGVARALDEKTKKLFIVEACRSGIDRQEFGRACCGMSFMGEFWSGSYVPVLKRKISFLDDLEAELSNYKLNEYRLEISSLKEGIERQIYAVEEDEFIRR